MRLSFVLPLALASLAAAQDARPRVVDMVVATVNDSAILWSELRTAMVGRINAEREHYGGLTPQRERAIQREVLNDLIDRRRMAQAAKTFGVSTPEQVESWVQSAIDRDRQEMVRDLGTQTAVSQELKRTGRTWQTKEAELRQEKLADIADELSVNRRLAQQANGYLTPLMLRQTYARNREMFVHPPFALVAQVQFRGPDAEKQAREAAVLWRNQSISGRELASRYPGSIALDPLMATSLTGDLQEFALRGPKDQVDEPRAIGDRFQVAKILNYEPARNGTFEDPEVQKQLRELCRRQVIVEFRQQALERARDRTEVWIAPPLR